MPADFVACVRDGGRVRTKDLGGGKYMRICFDKNGKSHAGEVSTKKERDMDICIQSRILEKQVDEGARTVTAGILEGDSASLNKRFYPMSVVESVSNLVGTKSLIGHDTDSPEDIVALITASAMSGKRLIGSFKFGTDEKSEMMFRKIKEGLVDSVSIRASGETKPGRINNEDMDIVQSLKIWSVDWVVSGGVESAKVIQVFEQAPTIEYVDDKKEGEQMDEQLKKDLEAANAKIEELEKAKAELEEKLKAIEEAKVKAELDAYKKDKLSTIEDKDVRKAVEENLVGDTKEAIDVCLAKLLKLAESASKKNGAPIKVEPVGEGEPKKPSSVDEVLSSKDVDKKDKIDVLSALMSGK